MTIRPDFKEIENLINRLIAYQKEFADYNERWGYLKNKEDFYKVYDMEGSIRNPLEDLYSEGRNLAISMSYSLTEFNDIGSYPTFASFVNELEKRVNKLLKECEEVINKAKQKILEMEHCPWAVKEMIFLYEKQINILASFENWIGRARNTKLYKEESGEISQ